MPRRPHTRRTTRRKNKKKITARLLPDPGENTIARRNSQRRKKIAKKTTKKRTDVRKRPIRKENKNTYMRNVLGDVFGKMHQAAIREEKILHKYERERKQIEKRFLESGEISDTDDDSQPSTSKRSKTSRKLSLNNAANNFARASIEDEEMSDENSRPSSIPIESVPLRYSIPYEELVDILKYLDQHESEKCLLVSKRWSSIISHSKKNLPSREKIDFYNINNAFWLKRKSSKSQEPVNSSKAETLQKCLVTKFEISRFNDEIMEELERMSKFVGRQIATQEVRFTVDEDFEEMGLLKFLPKILKKIIRARKVVLVLKSKVLITIFKNPRLLKIPDPPREVELKSAPNYYTYGGKYSDSAGICASEKVLKFITNEDLGQPNRLSLNFESQLDGFWKKYIDYFLTTNDLNTLPKCIQIDPAINTIIFNEMKKYLKTSKSSKSTLGSDDNRKFIYKFTRTEGLTLQIIIGKNLPTYYTVLTKEELKNLEKH